MEMLNAKFKNKNDSEKKDIVITFIIAFILMCMYIIPKDDMISRSGDAASIWNAIKTFRSEYRESSYVMYKGFLSVYPYIYFYDLASILKLDGFIFIKLYHVLCFSYITAVGFPKMIVMLLEVKINLIKRILFVVLTFYMWEYTLALSQLMIDLPSLALFILMVNTAMKISKDKKALNKKNILIAGLLIGMGFCFSGQYSLATLMIFGYLLLVIFEKKIYLNLKKSVLILMILVIGISIPISYNNHFENTVIKEFRDRGDWLPKASDWVKFGITRDLNKYDMAKIKSNRGESIIRKHEGLNYYEVMKLNEVIDSGKFYYR